MSRGDAFSGVAPESTRCPDRGTSAFYGGRFFRIQAQSRDFSPAHIAIRLLSCIFFARGELDGAEGIDGAET